jgi:type IV pilus assembly protein PilF
MRFDVQACLALAPSRVYAPLLARSRVFAGLYLLVLLAACAGAGKTELSTAAVDSEARKRARVYLELASTYFADGMNSYALDAMQQSLAADNGLYEAHNLRGLIYMRMNEPALAEEGFRKALAVQAQAASVQHNYGWFLCQQGRMGEAMAMFSAALANPTYDARAKTWLTQGLCQAKAGQMADAENSLWTAFSLEPANPVVSYNLALHLFKQGDHARAHAFIAPVNASQWANAQTLWLGIKLARKRGDGLQVTALSASLRSRFAPSPELSLLDKGVFDD